MIPNKTIIVGGGSSIRQNMWDTPISDLLLWSKIKNEFTIGTNWSYKYFNSTILMYNDYQFYGTEKENLQNIPLILGKEDGSYQRKDGIKHDNNVILLKECQSIKKRKYNECEESMHPHYWRKQAWEKGFYSSQLIGLKALNLAIALDCDEIYLLGNDACDINGHTHFYDDTNVGHYMWNGQKYSGVGKNDRGLYNTGTYNKIDELNNFWFKPYEEELQKGIKIFNVSLNSKIDIFPKISYEEFYNKLSINKQETNHHQIRDFLRKKLNEH